MFLAWLPAKIGFCRKEKTIQKKDLKICFSKLASFCLEYIAAGRASQKADPRTNSHHSDRIQIYKRLTGIQNVSLKRVEI